MDWPLVTLLLGLLVPITVALIKFLPRRSTPVATCNGERQRLHTDVEILKTRYDSFMLEVQQLRKEMDDLGQKLETVRATIVQLIQQAAG